MPPSKLAPSQFIWNAVVQSKKKKNFKKRTILLLNNATTSFFSIYLCPTFHHNLSEFLVCSVEENSQTHILSHFHLRAFQQKNSKCWLEKSCNIILQMLGYRQNYVSCWNLLYELVEPIQSYSYKVWNVTSPMLNGKQRPSHFICTHSTTITLYLHTILLIIFMPGKNIQPLALNFKLWKLRGATDPWMICLNAKVYSHSGHWTSTPASASSVGPDHLHNRCLDLACLLNLQWWDTQLSGLIATEAAFDAAGNR